MASYKKLGLKPFPVYNDFGLSTEDYLKLCAQARRWVQLSLWAGKPQDVARHIHFATVECGGDRAFIDAMIERVKPRAVPWTWRDDCLAEWKRRHAAPHVQPKRFEEPSLKTALAGVFEKSLPPAAQEPELEKRFAQIADRVRAGETVILWGISRINRYRVLQGKTGPEIIAPSGERKKFVAENLKWLTEDRK